MVMDEGEATSLSQATVRVLEEFDIKPDPKIEAIVGLIMTAGSIYGPKAYEIHKRLKESKSKED